MAVYLSRAEQVRQLAQAGEDPWWIYAYSTMFDSIREQRWESVSGEFERLTGHPPRLFREVLADSQATCR
jgi:NAD(P)H dehydrogenase (quinone)